MSNHEQSTEKTTEEIFQILDETELNKYAVMFITVVEDMFELHHTIMYGEYPNDTSIAHNYEELRTDPDFKLEESVMGKLNHLVLDLSDEEDKEFLMTILGQE